MSGLSGGWLVLSLLQLVAWIGACVLAGGTGPFRRPTRSAAIVGLAFAGTVAAVAGLGIALALVAVDWAWGAEKVLVAAPFGLLGSVVATTFAVADLRRARRDEPAEPILFGILISAAIGALAGPIALLLIGAVVTWPAVLAVGIVWIAGSAVSIFATARRSRRLVVSTGAVAGLGVALLALFTVFGPTVATAATGGHHLPPSPAVEGATVSVADLRETDTGGEVRHFDLEARHQTITLPDGTEYDAVTFGSVPGPQLVVTEGELVDVTLANLDIEEGVTLHWHGYDVPSGDDGVAGVTQDAVAPGESFTYRFVAEQVGTYWYHTHQDALEGIVRGLYGAFIVLPAEAEQAPGVTDVTALIHTMSGTTLVGDSDVLRVPEIGPTRLRLVNTDQTPRSIVLDADTRLIALDGTDLAEPATVPAGTSLRIPAGGRADLLVDESRPVTMDVLRGGSSGVVIGGDTLPSELSFDGPEFDILDAASGPLPEWADGPFDVEASQILERLVRIVDGLPRLADAVNGATYPSIQPIVVHEGDIVAVTIINRGTETHPMHIHGHHVLVLSRNGVTLDEALWLDTVDVQPGETWQVAFVADNPGLWMDHCHNLEHAANGMVMHLAYVGVTSPFELGGEHGNAPE
jgi:FtsP/CotA-like multicopper oxidase with cupredoxin domain